MKKIANYLENYMKHDMLKQWTDRTLDEQYGGYLTSFDRKWNVTDTAKGAWSQGRHVYTFSYAYHMLGEDEKYKNLAKSGLDFMVNKMYDGHGRFFYLVSQDGNTVIERTISIFSDAFALLGLIKYMSVFADYEYNEIFDKTYTEFEKNILNDSFKDINPYVYEENISHHAIYMIAVNVATEASVLIGNKSHKLINFSLSKIFNILYDDTSKCILEKKMSNGSFYNGNNAGFVNVGHVFEAMWFCIESCMLRNDNQTLNKIIEICESVHEKAMDKDGNRLFSFTVLDEKQNFDTWKYEIVFEPSDKVFWCYSEELYLWCLLYTLTGEKKYKQRAEKLFVFCKDNFEDKEYGDWFHCLDKNNVPKYDLKGSTIKSAFHAPRAFMRIMELTNNSECLS